jgi:hypothetical protein
MAESCWDTKPSGNTPEIPERIVLLLKMIYVPGEIRDGLYLLNIQTLAIELDVSPSRIVVYPLVSNPEG